MDQTILSQYAHRIGFTLSTDSFCDGCNHEFENGEMAFRCLECSGFICPAGGEQTFRQTAVTTNVKVTYGTTQLDTSETKSYTGYDLCLTYAKQSHMHSHHHFTLTTCRK